MVELTLVQETLLDQLKIQNRFFIPEYNIKTMLTIDNGLRLCSRYKNRHINIDITYNHGLDLYDIKAYNVNLYDPDVKPIAEYTEVYFDQLHDLIKDILFKKEN